MAGWQDEVPECFGVADAIFAGHPLDEDRAKQLLKVLRAQHVPWQDVEKEFRKHLVHRRCTQSHINEQMERDRQHMKAQLP